MSMTTRVIVADGEPLFRKLAQLLATQPDIRVVGEAGDTARRSNRRGEQPDVVLLALTCRRPAATHAASAWAPVKVIARAAASRGTGTRNDVHGVLQRPREPDFDRIRAVKMAQHRGAAPSGRKLTNWTAWKRGASAAREQEVLA
jgi:DNA-binding NarL/FixJ family response regulator